MWVASVSHTILPIVVLIIQLIIMFIILTTMYYQYVKHASL